MTGTDSLTVAHLGATSSLVLSSRFG